MRLLVDSPVSMEALGGRLADLGYAGMQIHLSGELGAGKTTLVRGFLRRLGYSGVVKSPTYTLVESYSFPKFTVYHFDFYRITHADEMEAIGFRDYRSDGAVCLIEWPEMVAGKIDQPDILIQLEIQNGVRLVKFSAGTDPGKSLISNLF